MGAYAQDAQQAAADAAALMDAAPAAEVKVEKPNLWVSSLKTNVNFGQTSLTNWAAGGDNTVSLAAYIDGNANWKKNDMFWPLDFLSLTLSLQQLITFSSGFPSLPPVPTEVSNSQVSLQ